VPAKSIFLLLLLPPPPPPPPPPLLLRLRLLLLGFLVLSCVTHNRRHSALGSLPKVCPRVSGAELRHFSPR